MHGHQGLRSHGSPFAATRRGHPPTLSAAARAVAASYMDESSRPPSALEILFLSIYSPALAGSRRPIASSPYVYCVQIAPGTEPGCNAQSCRRVHRAFANDAASWWL